MCFQQTNPCEVALNGFGRKEPVPKLCRSVDPKYFNKARGMAMAKLTVIHGKLRMS
jgi:hypothetical protein